MGAAMAYRDMYGDDQVLQVAAVTKLSRNLFIAGVIPAMGWYFNRPAAGSSTSTSTANTKMPSFMSFVPSFLYGFLGLACLRTLGDMSLAETGNALYLLDAPTWKTLTSTMGDKISPMLLATAMASVGMRTSFDVLRGVGYKPFLVGSVGALTVGASGLAMSSLLSHFSLL